MSFRVRFKIRSKKNASKAEIHYLYCRIRVDGICAPDFATGIACFPDDWQHKQQSIKGYSEDVRQKNERLTQIRAELTEIFNDLRKQEKAITAQIIKQLYTKKTPIVQSCLLAFYDKCIQDLSISLNPSTMKSWYSRRAMLQTYIESVLKRKDIELVEVTPRWLKDYYEYHIKNLKNSLSHAARAVQAVKRIMDYSVVEGALPYNATKSLKVARSKQKPLSYLNKHELEKFAKCPFYDDRLQRTVDCFCFQAYTGMAYNELLLFSPKKHLHVDNEGITWIMIYRGKTTELSSIPLLVSARQLLEKYDYNLPVITNQKMNEYLKEAARIAGFEAEKIDEFTTHLARRTAGMYLLNVGLKIETVSRILGHKSIKITEKHYAKLLTSSIVSDLRRNGLI
ncbi:integrase [Runella defluvii]|uniref:Integrase n=1 Tax=Runella defluvii TaxID=370973 RepID=A0A7W5ZSJ8_9BACT|nr:site-specific integrase [Runella defluvii]MBB3840777.1 integrase [Runella defluvii]